MELEKLVGILMAECPTVVRKLSKDKDLVFNEIKCYRTAEDDIISDELKALAKRLELKKGDNGRIYGVTDFGVSGIENKKKEE